jgi:hypothetical protein
MSSIKGFSHVCSGCTGLPIPIAGKDPTLNLPSLYPFIIQENKKMERLYPLCRKNAFSIVERKSHLQTTE